MATIKGNYVPGTGTINANTNIGFKLGLESRLSAADFTAQNGVFYLTSDSHRLYIGNADGSISPVNQGVINVPAMPTNKDAIPGQFYYITGDNILAMYNGKQWMQVNPDTHVTALAQNAAAVADGNAATIRMTLTQDGGNQAAEETIHSNLVTLKGGNDIVITVDEETEEILITDADYSLETSGEANAVKFNLMRDPADGDKAVEGTPVTFTGTNGVSITQKDNVITINAAELSNSADENQIESAAFANVAQGFDLTLKRKSGQSLAAANVDPIITYGETPNDQHFVNGKAALSVYTIAEVDAKIKSSLQSFNALTYRGTVGPDGTVTALPSSGVANGDVYMATGDYSDGATTYHNGTLFIAQGTEGVDGFITGAINWTQVENYNTDTQTIVNLGADNTLSLSNTVQDGSNPGGTTFLGSYKVVTKAGDPLATTDVTTARQTGGSDKVVTISHNVSGYTHTKSTASTADDTQVLFSTNELLKNIGVDDWGHVKSSVDTTIEVPTEIFSEAETTAVSSVTGTAGAKMTGTFTDSLALKNAGTGKTISTITTKTQVSSETLTLAVDGSALKMDLMWGSF